MKNTWNGINSLIKNNRKKSKVVSSLKHLNDNSTTKDPLEISNIFNRYFSSVGHNWQHKYQVHPTDSLNISHLHVITITVLSSLIQSRLMISNVRFCLSLKTNLIVSTLVRFVFYPVLNIFYLVLSQKYLMSVQKGVFPSKLKEAKVIPVYKSDDETEPGNYRPISLLSVFNRIFEKLMYQRLNSFLAKNNVLFKAQYCFREKHSTQHAILDTVNIIQNNMDLKLFTCGIFIDLKKAFDTVDHAILLPKLDHYGIRGIINDWFSSYLVRRSQVTEVDTYLSSKSQISYGVP